MSTNYTLVRFQPLTFFVFVFFRNRGVVVYCTVKVFSLTRNAIDIHRVASAEVSLTL